MTKRKGGDVSTRLFLALLLACVMSSFIVSADGNTTYDRQKAVSWLKMNVNEANSVSELSMGMLAMKQSGININSYLDVLSSKEDKTNKCFPAGGCNPKDTAFAILALKDNNKDASKYVKWLNDNLAVSGDVNSNELNIQITTDGIGKCLIYDGQQKKADVYVNGTGMLKIGNENMHWISFSRLGIAFDQPIKTIKVDCRAIKENVIASLLRIKGNVFYIEQESSSNNAELVINRACYGSNGQCNKQGSFYAAWVLKEIGEEIKTMQYLKENTASAFDYAILNILEQSTSYSKWLKDNQEGDNWDDVYTTSFVVYSLKNSDYETERNDAVSWMNTQQNNDGSFGASNKVMSTAAALYLGFGGREPPAGSTPAGNGQGITPSGAVCGDNAVGGNEECDGVIDTIGEGAKKNCENNCGDDCKCKTFPTVCTKDSDCDEGQKCGGNEECYTVTDCGQNSDCREGEQCDVTTGLCSAGGVVSGKKCTKDNELLTCNTDEKCDEVNGACIKKSETPSAQAENCTNGKDDNGDGKIDCDDADCADDPACAGQKGSSWWVWLIVFIVALIGGGIFLYGKFAKPKQAGKPNYFGFGMTGGKQEKPKGGKPSGPVIQRPAGRIFNFRRSGGAGKDTELESKLDRSIKEVENILKRGK